jgi:hypothetical protein
MAWHDDFSFQLGDTGDSSIEVVDLKPKQHAISVRLVLRVTNPSVVVFDLKTVQLKDQRIIQDQSLIFRAAMRTVTAKEMLIPAAARRDIAHADEGL